MYVTGYGRCDGIEPGGVWSRHDTDGHSGSAATTSSSGHCSSAPPLACITFGSMGAMGLVKRPLTMLRVLARALQIVRTRAVLLTGTLTAPVSTLGVRLSRVSIQTRWGLCAVWRMCNLFAGGCRAVSAAWTKLQAQQQTAAASPGMTAPVEWEACPWQARRSVQSWAPLQRWLQSLQSLPQGPLVQPNWTSPASPVGGNRLGAAVEFTGPAHRAHEEVTHCGRPASSWSPPTAVTVTATTTAKASAAASTAAVSPPASWTSAAALKRGWESDSHSDDDSAPRRGQRQGGGDASRRSKQPRVDLDGTLEVHKWLMCFDDEVPHTWLLPQVRAHWCSWFDACVRPLD